MELVSFKKQKSCLRKKSTTKTPIIYLNLRTTLSLQERYVNPNGLVIIFPHKETQCIKTTAEF